MKTTLNIALAIVLFAFMNGCGKENTTDQKADVKSKLKSSEIVEASNKFGFELFKSISGHADGQNVFVSPFSALEALSMTYNGANGTTKTEMANVLGFTGFSDSAVNAYNKSLVAALKLADPKVIFEVANSIWYRNDFNVLQSFIDVNRVSYDAEVSKLDFASPGALATINNWCKAKTKEKIPEILDQIPANAVMYLINAIYFKGTWMYQFDKKKTIETNFYKEDNTSVKHQQMAMEAEIRHYADNNCSMVEIPYGDGAFNFIMVLPAVNFPIDSFAKSLNAIYWKQLTAQMKNTSIIVKMPKYKFEFSSSLNKSLVGMGMPTAFGLAADFSRINVSGGIFISRVIHKTFIELNEEGTEAAAATAVEIGKASIGQFFVADRPFIYAITEKSTGAVLFIGRMMDPTITSGEL